MPNPPVNIVTIIAIDTATIAPKYGIKLNNGNIEDALKRFKRQCARNGVLQEVRKREHYEKPSVKRKKKSEAARKRKI